MASLVAASGISSGECTCNSCPGHGRDVLLHLVGQDLVESRCDIGGDGFFLITETGKQMLSDRWKKAVRQIAAALAAIATLAIGLIGLLNQLGLLSVQAK